jgi:hypothetical protein
LLINSTVFCVVANVETNNNVSEHFFSFGFSIGTESTNDPLVRSVILRKVPTSWISINMNIIKKKKKSELYCSKKIMLVGNFKMQPLQKMNISHMSRAL